MATNDGELLFSEKVDRLIVDVEDQKAPSTGAQDRALLKALQEFMIPLIHMTVVAKRKNDINETPLEPEAGKLVTALREFIISSILYSQREEKNVKTSLTEEDISLQAMSVADLEKIPFPKFNVYNSKSQGDNDDNDPDEATSIGNDVENKERDNDDDENNDNGENNKTAENDDDDDDNGGIADREGNQSQAASENSGDDSDKDGIVYNPDTVTKPISTFEEKLLQALREHVFNRMPIRLLRFDCHGSSLQINLVEKGVVFAHFESMMRAKMHEAEFRPRNWLVPSNVQIDQNYMEQLQSSPESLEEFLQRFGHMETDQQAIDRLISKYVRYAILSHTWLRTAPGEVTFNDWNRGLFDHNSPGCQKLVNFCKIAWKDYGISFGWMDTICINKESSSELDESIRSMYNWYQRAAVCIVYLAETGTLSDMHLDPWFTRGWTLQELIAPGVFRIYNGDWNPLIENSDNDRFDTQITKQIEQATTISEFELNHIGGASISRKMQLAATRQVTREEDTAYSLMGIFNVSIATAYGEGARRAFSRLLQEILIANKQIMDIFNWAGELPSDRPHNSNILPTSPQHYLLRYPSRHKLTQNWRPTVAPTTLTHLGLHVPVLLIPGLSFRDEAIRYNSIGDYNATVNISLKTPELTFDVPFQMLPSAYHLLDHRLYDTDCHIEYWEQLTFAVLNFGADTTNVWVPKTCLAKAVVCEERAGRVSALGEYHAIDTEVPVVFKLNTSAALDKLHVTPDFYSIPTEDLPKHGMQLISLYL